MCFETFLTGLWVWSAVSWFFRISHSEEFGATGNEVIKWNSISTWLSGTVRSKETGEDGGWPTVWHWYTSITITAREPGFLISGEIRDSYSSVPHSYTVPALRCQNVIEERPSVCKHLSQTISKSWEVPQKHWTGSLCDHSRRLFPFLTLIDN